MEGGGNLNHNSSVGVGPTTTTTTTSSRPIRTSSRYYTFSAPSNFSGPVRRWQKRWVHVSPSQPSIPKPTRKPSSLLSNVHKSATSPSPILLCKWTPLPSSTHNNANSPAPAPLPRRKLRYTPIAVVKEQKGTAKKVPDQDFTAKTRLSGERQTMDFDDSYGMLDMNSDLTESHEESSKSPPISQYSRRKLGESW